MNDISQNHLSEIDIRPDVGIVRSPLDEIKAIKTLLADVYKDPGDGRTLFREIVQNADDACAHHLVFTVLERGWPVAQNSLLRGPALLVANDGAFTDENGEALHKAVGGSKEDDAAKIGTFGIGLKSIFHICEAFIYIGASNSKWKANVLNPWVGTGEDKKVDPLHPDWDCIKYDASRLRSIAIELLGPITNGFLLWIPLRIAGHRNRGEGGSPYGLGEIIQLDSLLSWFRRPEPAAMLLAQCGHLQTIETNFAATPESVSRRAKLMHVERGSVVWVGRYDNENQQVPNREFHGEIASEGASWTVVGMEAIGSKKLQDLKTRDDWPRSSQWRNGQHYAPPRKALAHAAVTVLRPLVSDDELKGIRLRWAVFLPLDDDPEPDSKAIVESYGTSPAWEIVLHGYFWPSQDRRSIPGVTDEPDNTVADDMRSRWNRTLRDELLLPLLPSTLASAVVDVDQSAARSLLKQVECFAVIKKHHSVITNRHWLLPTITSEGVQWAALDSKEYSVLSIPKWNQAPNAVRRLFVSNCKTNTDCVIFIDHDAPRFSDELDKWTVDYLQSILNCIPVDEFSSSQSLRWIKQLFSHVLGLGVSIEDDRAATIAEWLVQNIGHGALFHTTSRSISRDLREELRDAWRDICKTLPEAWLLETPVECLQAVVELSAEGVVGRGLFLAPLGQRRGDAPETPYFDLQKLDTALFAIGRRLKIGDESGQIRHSRLLLAETLLSVRPEGSMDQDLLQLPLIKATKMPDDIEEAWSIVNLHRQIENYRVFSSPHSEDQGSEELRLERPRDPKQAVFDLASTLGESVWLINGDALGEVVAAPLPIPKELSTAVLRAERWAEPALRKNLFNRLKPSISNDDVRLAARVLLAGRAANVVGPDTKLFLEFTNDGSALRILLHLLGQSWRAIQGNLAESISTDLENDLAVSRVDLEVLHDLLQSCLEEEVDWSSLTDSETLHLLKDLHSADPEFQRRWTEVPLHRDINGNRVSFAPNTCRLTGSRRDSQLPPELESEVLILDPDSEVAHLYTAVPEMDNDGILELMLNYPQPWCFASRIVQNVRSADGKIMLPRDPDLRELMKCSRWLPQRNHGGLAPDAVLVAPKKVLNAFSEPAKFDVFGDKRLPNAVDPENWSMAETVVREVLGRLNRKRQLMRIIDALDSDRVAQVDGGSWLVFPDPKKVDASLVTCVLETALTAVHPGWKLVHTVGCALRISSVGDRDTSELLVSLTKALCGPVPIQSQIDMLTCLASSRPSKESDGGRIYRTLLECFTDTKGFFTDVLPKLELPTQDGKWHASKGVACTEIGVARRHLLISELRPILCSSGDTPKPLSIQTETDYRETQHETLEKYFQPWDNRLPHGAVGAFLSLLGSGLDSAIKDTAQKWLGTDVSIDGVRSDLIGPEDQNPCANVSVYVSPRVAHGDRVSAVNVLGSVVDMEAHHDEEILFATDPQNYPRSQYTDLAPLGEFWEITLRDVEPQNRTKSELIGLLFGTAERWATRVLELDREKISSWWSKWGESSQADLGPVLASIKANLPLTLQQLDVRESLALRNALRKTEQAQRKREQAPSRKTRKKERKAVDRLASLIKAPDHQEFLWLRANKLMQRYGYENDSVLLELAQNADDALHQAAQIKGGPLPTDSRQLLIQFHDNDVPTLDITHWGRPVNDTGGTSFPSGREQQWDQDLYFMMLMNLSGKPGEKLGDAQFSSTTGRFGLGFKSVHLISSSPSVISGFTGFSIAGALLPQEKAVPDEIESMMIEDRRPTRIRLPLRQDVSGQELINQVFSRFTYARVLLPVFARQLQKVTVEGGPFPGVHVFDGRSIESAPMWSIGAVIDLPNHEGRWQILRFRPSDDERKDMGTTALAVGIRNGVPTPFQTGVPFLWNVTPTSEAWGCGYAVNGPFKLDPGRTHVSLNDNATLLLVQSLGEVLGKALIDLHDALIYPPSGGNPPAIEGDSQEFLSSLWKVLASGVDNVDELRREFLLKLHGRGAGLSAWMKSRSVVPTGLPAPFSPLLPPLGSGISWEVAVDGLDDPTLCTALDEMKLNDADFLKLLEGRHVVSKEIDRLLCPLVNPVGTEVNTARSTQLRPCSLLSDLFGRWNYRLTPARLHMLRPLFQATTWGMLTDDPHSADWRGKVQAQATDGSFQPLRKLLLGNLPESGNNFDGDLRDEFLRSAFAPHTRIIDADYIEQSEDWAVFRWLRIQHKIDAVEIAKWYMDVKKSQRSAAIHYLLYGDLQVSVLSHLIAINARPHWLQNYDDVRSLLEDICDESWHRERLLGALFPDRHHVPKPPAPPNTQKFFQELLKWWEDAAVRDEVLAAYEQRAWPEWLRRDDLSTCLKVGSVDHWLALLILGACRSIGRSQEDQHRRFLEIATEKGWWDTFKNPDNVGVWMQLLRNWQDEAQNSLPYLQWMSLFPSIYQLSRYLEVYVRLLKSADLRPEGMYQITQLLAPRNDGSLTGTGTHFDAPPAPLNMGLHWILRELVRLRVLNGEHLFPDCWVPSQSVLNLLRPLGLDIEASATNSDKAHKVFEFLASMLEIENPNLHRGFDIPLLHYYYSKEESRYHFDLERL